MVQVEFLGLAAHGALSEKHQAVHTQAPFQTMDIKLCRAGPHLEILEFPLVMLLCSFDSETGQVK